MRQVHRATVHHLDGLFPKLRRAAVLLKDARPSVGWIEGLRTALGMSGRALAERMGVSTSTIGGLESSEREEKITLASLRRAAEALDAELIYAIVPRASLSSQIRARARAVANERMRPIAQSMRLEDQGLTQEQLERQTEELARDLESRPRELWR